MDAVELLIDPNVVTATKGELEAVKNDLAELLEEYDREEDEKTDILTEALDALEDAHDIVNEAVSEDM